MPATETVFPKPRADALLRITQAIEAATTLDELLLLALNELTQLFGVSRGGILLLSDDQQTGNVACEFPPQAAPAPPLPLAETPTLQRVVRTRQALQVHSNDDPVGNYPVGPFLNARQAKSAMVLPLIAQDRPIAVLFLYTTDGPRRFSHDETTLARVLAGQIAAAIAAFRLNEAAKRLNESAQRRNQELATLNEIAATVTSTLDAHEVYRLVVQKLNKYFVVDAGSILLIDESTGDLRFVMTIEGGEEKLAGVVVPMGQGVVGHVAQTGQWAIVHDAQSDPRFYSKVSEEVGYVTESILCVPMRAQGQVIGAIELLNKLNGRFTEDDAERLNRMAAFIGVAIQNARLFQQVADGRDRLAAILNSTADGILMTDMHGTVLSANPQAARLFNASEQELLGRPLDTLLADWHTTARSLTMRPWNGDEPRDDGIEVLSEIELGGAAHRFVRHLAMPVRDEVGAVVGQLAVFRDITQEKALEQLREDYTGMLVHDLRAPLTSIMNGIAMVQRGLGGPITDQQRELLGIAFQGSQALLELVNNLLDISRMEQGRMPLDPEPLSPYTIIDSAVDRISGSANGQRVALSQRLAVGLPLVEADQEKIVRVLQNLLDNAIKFSPSGGAVVLGAHTYAPAFELPREGPSRPPIEQGEWLVFWVRDDGPGIPPAYHERIFEKFGQVQGRKARGTGLGLTFCKLAVEAHNGLIWLESEEGAGSVFAFALPLRVASSEG